jgi:cytochrome P450
MTSEVADIPVEALAPHFDLYDPDHRKRLWEVVDYARTSMNPIIKTDADDGYFIVTRYDDLRAIAGDPETFSSAEPALRGLPVPLPPVSEDPPIHKDYRKILNPYFSHSYLVRFSDDIRAAAGEILDPLVETGRMEFMHDYALPFTAMNMTRVILGETNKERVKRAGVAMLRLSNEGTPEAWYDVAQIAAEFLQERAKAGFDGDDMLSALANGTLMDRPLTFEEQIGVVTTMFAGGLDTVRAALGNIARHIAQDPGMEERVRNPDWTRTDLDEFLRLESPILFLARTVTRDTEVNGCPMKAGDRLALHFGSANRDADYFDDAGELQFERERNPHLAFGIGIHRCLGLHFARLQIELGMEEFLSRVTNIRVPEGVEVELSNGVAFTPEKLPLEFDAR